MSSGRHVLLATDLDEVYGLTVNGGEPVFIRRASAPGRVVSTTKSVGICGSRAVTSGRWAIGRRDSRNRYEVGASASPCAAPPLVADAVECCPAPTVIWPRAETQRFHPIASWRKPHL